MFLSLQWSLGANRTNQQANSPIRFKIEDEALFQNPLAAWACIRLDRLCQGYRFIHLLDAKGEPTDGVLLVKINKRLY